MGDTMQIKMIKQKRNLVVIGLILLLIANITLSMVQAQDVTSHAFTAIFPSTSSLQFQNAIDKTVKLEVTSGALNSSNCVLRMSSNTGSFRFTALNNSSVKITFTVSGVQVSGDQNKETRNIQSGDTVSIATNNKVVITWHMKIEPWLPLMFIFGIIGLLCLVGGPMYAVYQIKHGKYREGFINGVIFTTLGFGLVLGWLWS